MEDYKSFTDSQLMQKVSEYDSKSLEELYDRYSPILYTLIKKIVADQKIAEEVLTDIFVIVWEKSRKIETNRLKSCRSIMTIMKMIM